MSVKRDLNELPHSIASDAFTVTAGRKQLPDVKIVFLLFNAQITFKVLK